MLFWLAPSPRFIDPQKEVLEIEVEIPQRKRNNESPKAKMSGVEMSKDISPKEENFAFSIPAGNVGDNPPQAIGIPASKTSINWLYYILLSLPLSALAGWLVLRKRYSATSTTGTTIIHEFHQEPRQEDSDKYPRDPESICAVKDNEEDKRITRIKEFMVAEQPYLDPEFTIKTMADQMDMEVRELSLLLNNSFQQNFYDFLNLYRIEKAKEILKDPKNKRLTILEILYSVGFNSKSSFNTSFRKLSGLTPTQYRQRYSK